MNFQDFLQKAHMLERPGVLDDDLPDDFDAWLESKDVNDILVYVEEYENLALKQDAYVESLVDDAIDVQSHHHTDYQYE